MSLRWISTVIFLYYFSFRIAAQSMIENPDFIKSDKSKSDAIHDVVVVVKSSNIDILQKAVSERSDPESPNFRKWLSSDDVGSIITNSTSINMVTSWLRQNNINITSTTFYSQQIHASAPISKWESLLNASFYSYYHVNSTVYPHKVDRSKSYTIPSIMNDHIVCILNTCQLPVIPIGQRIREKDKRAARKLLSTFRSQYNFTDSYSISNDTDIDTYNDDDDDDTQVTYDIHNITQVKVDANTNTQMKMGPPTVTIDYLNNLYSITTNKASPLLTQAVFSTSVGGIPQVFSQNDLNIFQLQNNILKQSAVSIGKAATTQCTITNCGEPNLDIQYLMGIAQGARSIVWYSDGLRYGDPFVQLLSDINNMNSKDPNRPTTISISYSATEFTVASSQKDHFNLLAMSLTAQGVTIVVSSGDYGASDSYCSKDSSSNSTAYGNKWKGDNTWSGKGYFPVYPASCPYVVAVGASTIDTITNTEIAAMVANGKGNKYYTAIGDSMITTGGGFSSYYPRPAYQNKVVSKYLTTNSLSISPGYNNQGRGYPDVTLLGVNYQPVIDGNISPTDGTSASAPVFAAMITLINTKLLQQNKRTVGFINPLLYNNPTYFNDISSSGSNNCGIIQYMKNKPPSTKCCNAGFPTSKGWDPVTGLGSITYTNLLGLLGLS